MVADRVFLIMETLKIKNFVLKSGYNVGKGSCGRLICWKSGFANPKTDEITILMADEKPNMQFLKALSFDWIETLPIKICGYSETSKLFSASILKNTEIVTGRGETLLEAVVDLVHEL